MNPRNVRCPFALLLAAAFLFAAGTAAAAGPYTVIGSVSERSGGVTRSETTVQEGANPLDQFKFYRLSRNHPHGPVLLLLPPLGTSFSFYEQPDPGGPASSSIAGYFAARGYDVWGVSPRFEGLPSSSCEVGLFDCSVFAGWNLARLVEDVAYVRGAIAAERPGAEVVLGGASLGAILATAVADAAPADYDGLILWEGMLTADDPAVVALNQGYCAALEAQLAGGGYFEGAFTAVVKQAAHLARVHPTGLTPIRLFPPVWSNHRVLVTIFATVTPGPVTMPAPGYLLMNGDPADDRFFFASEARAVENLERFNNYFPVALVRDVSCSLAGEETAYTDGLAAFTGPILAIGGGRGFGPYLAAAMDRFGSTDTTDLLTPDFGHIDHFMTPDHRDYVERPILDWLRSRF